MTRTLLTFLLAGCSGGATDSAGDGSGDDTDTDTDTGDTGDTGDTSDTGDSADTGDSGDTAVEAIAIAGVWDDNYGGLHTISDAGWDQGWAQFAISQYDNDAMHAIAQSSYDSKWNRFDWTWDDSGQLWYCNTVYDAATEADALAATEADATDPATGGCGSFAWSSLTPHVEAISIRGTWDDNYGGLHVISDAVWDMGWAQFTISQYDNDAMHAIAQSSLDSMWNRFDWTWDDAGQLWYCNSVYDAATEADALAATEADATDPASGGCGSFAWSSLTTHVEAIAIAGHWVDNYSGSHTISSAEWDMGWNLYSISQYDNGGRHAIAQSDNDGMWNRFDWTWDDTGQLWYCNTVYDAATEADALAAVEAEATDPATGGCGTFAWSSLTPA